MTTWQQLYDADTDETSFVNVGTGQRLSEKEFKELAEEERTEVLPPPSVAAAAATTTTTAPESSHSPLSTLQHSFEAAGDKLEAQMTAIGSTFQPVGTAIDNAQDAVARTATWYWYAPWMERAETWLVGISVAFAATAIACVQQMLNIAPYSQMAVAYAFFSIGYLVLSTLSVGLWVYLYKERKRRIGTNWLLEFTLCSPKFWLYVVGWIAFFVCTMVMLRFIFAETWVPTYATMRLTRLGGVTHTTAAFFVRDPITTQGLALEWQVKGGDITTLNTLPVPQLNETDDFATWLTVDGLAPNTTYQWRRVGAVPNDTWFEFRTNPVPGTPSTFTFYFGSCYVPVFPSLDYSPGFGYVHRLNPDLIMFIGDFVYADVPYKEGDDIRTFRDLYRQAFRNPYTVEALESTPNYNQFDDHETLNDYAGPTSSLRYQNGIMHSWRLYMGEGNPRTKPRPHHWFWFDYGDSGFFVMDTRSNRSHTTTELKDVPADDPNTWIISHEQEDDLKAWLLAKQQAGSPFKFVFSPVGLPSDFRGHIVDSWGGFLAQRKRIFDFIRTHNITGTVFYTGDYHAAYALELERNGSQLYEFSASPVSAFDFTLGGYAPYSSDMWKDLKDRTERVLFTHIGNPGPVSLIGMVRVDTTASPPRIANEIYYNNQLVYALNLTVVDLMPGF